MVKQGKTQQNVKRNSSYSFKRSSSPSILSRRNSSVTSTPYTTVSTVSKTDPSRRITEASTPDMSGSVPSKRISNVNSSVITSPFTCGESFFEADAPMTQSHASYISSINRKSPGTSTSGYQVKGDKSSAAYSKGDNTGFSSPVFNFNKNAASILEHDTSNYNEDLQHSQNDSNFEFDYKITENIPAIKDHNRKSVGGSIGNQGNMSDDDMFAIEDFDDDFTEEMDLPTITTPSSKRKPGTEQKFSFKFQ